MGKKKKKKKKRNKFKNFEVSLTIMSQLAKNCDKIRTLVSNGIQ